MRRMVIVVLALAVAALGCVGSGDGSTADDAPVTSEPVTVPATSDAASTTVMSTTPPPPVIGDELWIAAYRRSFPGYAVELTEIGSGRQVLIPTDRLRPYPHRVYGDGAGGLVTMQPPMHLAAGARHPTALGDPDVMIDAVASIDGAVTALERRVTRDAGRDGTIEWLDQTTELVARPLEGAPRSVLETSMSWWFDHEADEGESQGGSVDAASYGGGVLALVLRSNYGECARLELRSGLGTELAKLVNPWPDPECGAPDGGLLDVAVTSDGSALIALVVPDAGTTTQGPDLVAWDLATGHEIDRVVGVMSFAHDGDRALAVDLRSGVASEVAIVVLSEDGFRMSRRPDISPGVLGIVRGPIRVAEGATLAPLDPWVDCSAANREPPLAAQTGLPEPVVATRAVMIEAIRSCDLVGLADVAAAAPDFHMIDPAASCDEPRPVTFEDDDPVSYWYRSDLEAGELGVMLDTLAASFAIEDGRYAWIGPSGYRIEIGAEGDWILDLRVLPQPPCEGIGCSC